MVDQLWLWALADGRTFDMTSIYMLLFPALYLLNKSLDTVITSFPGSWSTDESYDLTTAIMQQIDNHKDRHLIKSVEDLIYLILRASVDFFQRKGPGNTEFHECFQSSINDIVCMNLYHVFSCTRLQNGGSIQSTYTN